MNSVSSLLNTLSAQTQQTVGDVSSKLGIEVVDRVGTYDPWSGPTAGTTAQTFTFGDKTGAYRYADNDIILSTSKKAKILIPCIIGTTSAMNSNYTNATYLNFCSTMSSNDNTKSLYKQSNFPYMMNSDLEFYSYKTAVMRTLLLFPHDPVPMFMSPYRSVTGVPTSTLIVAEQTEGVSSNNISVGKSLLTATVSNNAVALTPYYFVGHSAQDYTVSSAENAGKLREYLNHFWFKYRFIIIE